MNDYDWRKDAAKSYNEAIKAIRQEKIKAGEIVPHEHECNAALATVFGPHDPEKRAI